MYVREGNIKIVPGEDSMHTLFTSDGIKATIHFFLVKSDEKLWLLPPNVRSGQVRSGGHFVMVGLVNVMQAKQITSNFFHNLMQFCNLKTSEYTLVYAKLV